MQQISDAIPAQTGFVLVQEFGANQQFPRDIENVSNHSHILA